MRFFVVSNQGYSLNNCYQIRLWIILIVALIKLFFLIKFQIYYYFVITTEKYDGTLLLRRNCYKRLKSFQFFYEGHIKTMELSFTELFIYVHSKVKPSMKNKCPAGSTFKCLGIMQSC